MIELLIEPKSWPVAGTFRISRSALTQIDTVWVSLGEGEHVGRGECRPYARYGDSVASVTQELEALRPMLHSGISVSAFHEALPSTLPPGPARNAVDCALWDLRAKQASVPVWELLGLPAPRPRITAYTLSVDTPEAMAKAARAAAQYPVLKTKISGEDSIACVWAICEARPDAKLIVDANEAIAPSDLADFYGALKGLNIGLIEQPIAAGKDDPNTLPQGDIPFCADESLHTVHDLPRLKAAGYRAVNVKLDKCGGLTAALELMQRAKAEGFQTMAGCMVASSLAMAPMMILESLADFIDLDGPLLLSEDCNDGLGYDEATIAPPSQKLWG